MDNCIGLRREDKNEWERRVVLSPTDVKELVDQGIRIKVESFPRRAFGDESYSEAGAEVVDSVRDCELVLGVKEMPLEYFREGGAYMFFSHTIKGQSYNMEMLRRLRDLHCTLIDYELVTDEKGRRLIFFSHHAGLVGMTDSLWTLGRRWQALGVETPLLHLEPAHHYADLSELKSAVKAVGREIETVGFPAQISPVTIGILGYGRVSQGAQEILELIPHRVVSPDELEGYVAAQSGPAHEVVMVVYREEHLVENTREGETFELQDYYDHPEHYRSIFEPHLENLSLLVNAIYWEERYPRFADRDTLQRLFARGRPRLVAVGDITCDVDGSLACTVRETEPGDPVYVYDPATGTASSGFVGDGLAVLAVGNLPSELPVEASAHFGRALRPFIPALAASDLSAELETAGLPDPIRRAVILWKGEFSPACRSMAEFLNPAADAG